MVVKSLNDLSISIHEIGKKYQIQSYVDEFKDSLKEISPNFWDNFETVRSTAAGEVVNPIEKILLLSSIITDDELDKVCRINKRLDKKYGYTDFLRECNNARQTFLRERSGYFSMRVGRRQAEEAGIGSYFEVVGMTDIMLSDWLDALLEKVYPSQVEIEYETMDGSTIKTEIAHRVCVVGREYVEAPLIDRYHGTNAYDQFLLHSVYDLKRRSWTYVPMRLIVSLRCDDISLDGINIP